PGRRTPEPAGVLGRWWDAQMAHKCASNSSFSLKCVEPRGLPTVGTTPRTARISAENRESQAIYADLHGWPLSCSSGRYPEARSVTARCNGSRRAVADRAATRQDPRRNV